jgi:hypothetical protein
LCLILAVIFSKFLKPNTAEMLREKKKMLREKKVGGGGGRGEELRNQKYIYYILFNE